MSYLSIFSGMGAELVKAIERENPMLTRFLTNSAKF